MRRHRRTTTVATAVALAVLTGTGCWDEIKEPQDSDSVGAYEPAAGPGMEQPTGGSLPIPLDSAARDSQPAPIAPPPR